MRKFLAMMSLAGPAGRPQKQHRAPSAGPAKEKKKVIDKKKRGVDGEKSKNPKVRFCSYALCFELSCM